MASTNNSKTKVRYVVLSVLISSIFLLAMVLENQNLYALTSGDRYTNGFSHGEQQATVDFQNNIPFNPVCVAHTTYYCAGYFKGYNITWNNLATNKQTSNPPASNSTNPLSSNTNTTAADPHTIISPSSDNWVGPFIISISVVIIIAAIAWKITHRKAKYKVRQAFPDSVKEKVLERQRHRCADCNRMLNVVDWHHKNRDRSDNRESNCVALCPNCHAIKTRRHQ
ncbi:MAG: HNH endonuclease signature motif containing protein [Candidatus Nitrosopolaris sp.]